MIIDEYGVASSLSTSLIQNVCSLPGVMRPIGGSEARLFRAGRDAFKCYYTVSRQCKIDIIPIILIYLFIYSSFLSLRSDFSEVVVEDISLLAIEIKYMPS